MIHSFTQAICARCDEPMASHHGEPYCPTCSSAEADAWDSASADRFESEWDSQPACSLTEPFPSSAPASTLLSESDHLRQQVRLMRAKHHLMEALVDLYDCDEVVPMMLSIEVTIRELTARTTKEAQRWH